MIPVNNVKFTNEQLAGQIEQELRQRHSRRRGGEPWKGVRTKFVIEKLAEAMLDRGLTKVETFQLIDEVLLYTMKE